MENESQSCGVCSLPYDTKDHTPRVLINCGHTLCASCLTEILKNPKLRKCPFDNSLLKKTQKYLDHFPPNFALLALLEQKNQNVCQTHCEELTIFCFQDNVKICSDCALFGEHKGHNLKKIKELKEKGVKLKKDLEESLMKYEKNQLENDQEEEALKKQIFSQMGNKLEETIQVLRAKELEWKKQVENLFKGKIDSQSRSLLKIEAEKSVKEIDQAIQKEENLMILDRSFSSIISRLQQPQVDKNELSRLSDETSKMMDCIETFLTDQEKPIKNFDLSEERRKFEQLLIKQKEQQEHLSSEASIQNKQKPAFFKSLLSFCINEEHLKISFKNSYPRRQRINLDEFNKITKIKVEFERYGSLFQEDSTDLTTLSEILTKLDNYTSLMVVFLPSGLTDDHAINLFNLLFCRTEHLTGIVISFEQCNITDEPILFFCKHILPKATSLKYMTLKLGSTRITDKSLFAFAESLSPFRRTLLCTFRFGIEHTEITDEGIKRIFNVVTRPKELDLNLKGTLITDYSLKVLGENLMSMKKLEKFTLDASDTKITMEGVNAIFTGLPQNISELLLDFDGIDLSDEVISLFEEKVYPKLKLAEAVSVKLKGKGLRAEISKTLERVRKDAEERRKSCKANKI